MADDERPGQPHGERKTHNEMATAAELGGEDGHHSPLYGEDGDSEHATDVVDPLQPARQRSRAVIVVLVLLGLAVAAILLIVFLLSLLGGGVEGEYCPGTDLANRVDSAQEDPCNQRIENP